MRSPTEPIFAEPQQGESSYLGQVIDGRYRIIRLVGRGGMGTVFEVEQVHLQKIMALKLLHEDLIIRKQLISRFTREARAVSRLENPHTVRVFDFGRADALFYLVMEFLDGEDLEVLLSREGALPWRRALLILDQVCQSLDEAHAMGIVHRDLKPENIMILRNPPGHDYVKVLDFGLAKIQNTDDVFSVHSQRDLFGTPFYMAPEQIRSEGVDHRADIYALGCLAYRMLTNQHVYDAQSTFDVLRQHLTSPIPSACRMRPNAGIPARVDRMVFRALAKRANNRYQTAAALREEIRGCIEDPEGQSFALPTVQDAEPLEEIDTELAARLKAFDVSASEADGRMNGAVPPELPSQPVTDRRSAPAWPVPPKHVDHGLSDIIILDPHSDEARYAQDVRRERKLRKLAFVLGTIAVIAVTAAIVLWRGGNRGAGSESEPNDTVKKANALEPGTPLEGALGKRLSTFESDRDVYRLRVGHGAGTKGTGRFLDLELSPIADLDLALDLMNPEGDLLATFDTDGIGAPESMRRFRVTSDEVLIAVREAKAGDAEPTEKPDEKYRLLANVYDTLPAAGEIEHNDTSAAASPIQRDVPALGFLEGPRDVDVFRVEAPGSGALRRWELAVESPDGLVTRIALARSDGDASVLLFSDEGGQGVLRTVFEEETPSRGAYFVAVSHAGRGNPRGEYRLTTTLSLAYPRKAAEPDDDRQRATHVAAGESVSGVLDRSGDVDVFAVSITDPQRRAIELVMDPLLRQRLRIQIADVNKLNVREYPRPGRPGDGERPKPPETGPIRFEGQGEVYYVTISGQDEAAVGGAYSFRIRRVVGDPTPKKL